MSTPDQRQRGRPLQRRVTLFITVLPCLAFAISRRHSASNRAARRFWTELLNPCIEMELVQSQFDRVDNSHDWILKRVLEKLEALVCDRSFEISEDFRAVTYPRLQMICHEEKLRRQERTLAKAHDFDDECDDDLYIELQKPETATACAELVNSLKALSQVVKDDSKQPLPEEVYTTSKVKPIMSFFLKNLFSTISKTWRCACVPNHQAALLLYTHRTLPAIDFPVTFTVLLSRGMLSSSTKRWKEAIVTVANPSDADAVVTKPRPRVRIDFPSPTLDIGISTPVKDLCSIIKKSEKRINLKVNGFSLSHRAETLSKVSNYERCEHVSFTAGILENDVSFNYEAKLCLALILSCTFLDFCDGSWFANEWTNSNLYFMQRSDQLFLQPFLITNMAENQAKQDPHSTPMKSTKARKLLQHGILLMEIFQQDSFTYSIGTNGKVQSLEHSAYTWFRSIDWDVCERLVQIVETCIQGELVDLCSQPNEISDEEFVRLFCEKILAPLEADFAVFYPKEDPDQVISRLSLPRMAPKAPASFIAKTKKPKPTFQKSPIYQSRAISCLPQSGARDLNRFSSSLVTPSPPGPKFFFHAENCPDPIQAKSALRWFSRVNEKVIREKTRRPRESVNRERGRQTPSPCQIKIAVLDTGINLKNTWINGESRRVQSWPANEDHNDNHGHGTHVAYLLLRLAPNALLRVCKVSNTTLLSDANIDRIAKAITHFSVGKARVDIINLSFGFNEYTKELTPMFEAIRIARNNGVVIFAAAGNEGGNQSVSWPAALYSSGDLVCISSSNDHGVQSGFSPEVEHGRRICTLGEGVPSCEPDLSSSLGVVHRSGTSFATPIAAAIAAIVLAVMDKADYNSFEEDKELFLPRLRTARGMESVLCKTCVAGSGWNNSKISYIAPWFFVNVEDKILVPKILDILKSIPESPFPLAEEMTLVPG